MISVIIVSVIYLLYVFIKYKTIPGSLSETAYLFGKNKWIFTIYCMFISIMMIGGLLNVTSGNWQFLPVLICVGLAFSGASPLYRKSLTKDVHYGFAILSFVSFLIYLLVIDWRILIVYLISLGYLFFVKSNSLVFFAEILALIYLIIIYYN